MNDAQHDFKQYNDTRKHLKCVFPLFMNSLSVLAEDLQQIMLDCGTAAGAGRKLHVYQQQKMELSKSFYSKGICQKNKPVLL